MLHTIKTWKGLKWRVWQLQSTLPVSSKFSIIPLQLLFLIWTLLKLKFKFQGLEDNFCQMLNVWCSGRICSDLLQFAFENPCNKTSLVCLTFLLWEDKYYFCPILLLVAFLTNYRAGIEILQRNSLEQIFCLTAFLLRYFVV